MARSNWSRTNNARMIRASEAMAKGFPQGSVATSDQWGYGEAPSCVCAHVHLKSVEVVAVVLT